MCNSKTSPPTTKVHETNFLRAGIFFFSHTYFSGFFLHNLWHNATFFGNIFFCFKIVGTSCHGEPLRQKKVPSLWWTTATKENSFVAVNHRDEGKFLRRSEPPLRRKIPMLQWTTATKERSFVAVNHSDEGKFQCCSEPLQRKIHP